MAKPRTNVAVPTGVATQIQPALSGLSTAGKMYVFTDQPGWFGTDATLSSTTGFPHPGGYKDYDLSLPILGQISAIYFYHNQPSDVPVFVSVWIP